MIFGTIILRFEIIYNSLSSNFDVILNLLHIKINYDILIYVIIPFFIAERY